MRDPRDKEDVKFIRYYLKDNIRQEILFEYTDQRLGQEEPPIQKPVPAGAEIIPLPEADDLNLGNDLTVREAICRRMSRRSFAKQAVTLRELSYLLWATGGIRHTTKSGRVLRNVPSAGNRHSTECYIAAVNIEDLDAGMYRYLPREHALVKLVGADAPAIEDTSASGQPQAFAELIDEACLVQGFPAKAAVTFFWTTIPYRTEWRYAQASTKVIAMDAGHIMQNLYLAAESIQCGCCAMAAFDQGKANKLVQVDGDDEFVIYAASLGKQLRRAR